MCVLHPFMYYTLAVLHPQCVLPPVCTTLLYTDSKLFPLYRVDDIVKENDSLKRRCDTYESSNKSLISQLNKLQQLVKRISPRQVTAQTSTCLLVSSAPLPVLFMSRTGLSVPYCVFVWGGSWRAL